MRRLRASLVVILSVCVSNAAGPQAAQQTSPLPIGKIESGTTSSEKPTTYEFKAATAGVLSIALQGDGDLAIVVMDSDGQPVQDGSSDRDMYGSSGTEQMLVTIPEPGTYRVAVRLLDGAGKFQIGGSWIPFPARARPSDPDKRPASARALEAGRTHEDSLDTANGDAWDWFVYTPKTAGTLTIILRPIAGGESQIDLQLEVFLGGNDFSQPTMRSDQDLQDNPANESVTVEVAAGQKVYAKVSGATGSAVGKYRISSSLIQQSLRLR
jgi:hypothetical protein